jgi:hypothetical protein
VADEWSRKNVRVLLLRQILVAAEQSCPERRLIELLLKFSGYGGTPAALARYSG